MPTPSFNTVVLTLASDPLTPVIAYSSSRSESHGVSGGVTTYANGRQRSTTQAGIKHSFTLTLRNVSDLPVTLPSPGAGVIVPLQLLQTAWMGATVVFRDFRGRYFQGIYFAVGTAERKSPHLYDVAIQINELTPDS